MSSPSAITPEDYQKLITALHEYLRKSGKKCISSYVSALQRYLQHLHAQGLAFTSVRVCDVDAYAHKHRGVFPTVRDFLIKYGYVVTDVRAGVNAMSAQPFGRFTLSIR